MKDRLEELKKERARIAQEAAYARTLIAKAQGSLANSERSLIALDAKIELLEELTLEGEKEGDGDDA